TRIEDIIPPPTGQGFRAGRMAGGGRACYIRTSGRAGPDTMSDLPPTVRTSAPPPLPRRGRKRRPPRPRRRVFSRFGKALLGWEVLRAGRRTGTLAIARTALGGLLLAAMWALWTASFYGQESNLTGTGTVIGKRLTQFAEWFAITFFMVQAAVVLLL